MTADSEIGFEFEDEHGGHFQALSAPYADRFCVAAGDVFDGPHAVDATDLNLPVQRLEALVADGARLSAHFATMFDAATRDAALPSSKEP